MASAGATGVPDVLRSFDRMWSELEPIGRDRRTGGYHRFVWTREDHTLREWFAAEAAARGLDLVEDRAGNQWAWWGDPDAAPGTGVVLGSHLDSVPDGGAFDGPLGVVSAFAAVDLLRERGVRTGRPLAVVNFGDEEGARFGMACAGSRILTGALSPDRALGLVDADGITMAEALTGAGRATSLGVDPEALRRIGAFVELHVEQGRMLADLDPATSAVAVGTGIWPHGRWRIELPGTANHAGTTCLGDRDDALLKAAEVISTARTAAAEHSCVATIGRLQVHPNGINAIPAHVTAHLDARGTDVAAVHSTVATITAAVEQRGGTVHETSWTGATGFNTDLVARVARSAGDHAPQLDTGAGHDAGILAHAGIPTAMLFVRNPTGISHSPGEHAAIEDCHEGVRVLARVAGDLVR